MFKLTYLLKIIFRVLESLIKFIFEKETRLKLYYLLVSTFGCYLPNLWRKNYRKNSGEEWLNLKNKFAGKRCFIIGSAPSIQKLDLTKLNSEYTFTCNKGFLLANLGLQKSMFYTITDDRFYRDFKEYINEKIAKYFFVSTQIPFDKHWGNLFFYESSAKYMYRGHFQLDIQKPLAVGCTVVLDTLQIAVYLGFNKIILIGVDLNFSKNELHFYKSSNSELVRIADKQSIEIMLQSFEYATKFLAKHNIELYNASPEGNLNCMTRVKYDDLFQ